METEKQERDSVESWCDLMSRRKVAYISEKYAIALLNCRVDEGWTHLALPIMRGVPHTARVVHLFACPERRAIGVVLCDPAFEPVADGDVVPPLRNDGPFGVEMESFQRISTGEIRKLPGTPRVLGQNFWVSEKPQPGGSGNGN